MKKLLVPTDFSGNAMKAVTYAAEIATRTGAEICLLHVIEPDGLPVQEAELLQDRHHDEIYKSGLAKLNELKSTVSDTYNGISIQTEIIFGTVATSILHYAEKIHAEIVVMGTKGASGIKEILVGSVAGTVIGRSRVPVLAIPYEYLMEEPDAIVLATNRFEKNLQLLDKVVELASLFNAAIHAVVFVETDRGTAADYLFNRRQVDYYLSFLSKTYPGVQFTGELLEGEKFEKTIEDYDTKKEVDMIAMITYPKSRWDKMLNRSATKKMAFHSKIPVLAIPAGKE